MKTITVHCPACGVKLGPDHWHSHSNSQTGEIIKLNCTPKWKPGKHWGCADRFQHLHWDCPQCGCKFTTPTAEQKAAAGID